MHERFQRQADFVPRDRLNDLLVTVIGVGAIGRQAALQLSGLGIPHLQLVDFDRVDTTNITTQGYSQSDVGLPKVEATRAAIERLVSDVEVECVDDRFRPTLRAGHAVFCCVDSIATRSAIWRSVSDKCLFWCDGRMLGEVIRVLAAAEGAGADHYSTTLFDSAAAQVGRCTARSTIYAASIAAGMMMHQFTRWLRDIPVEFDQTLNLLAGELLISAIPSKFVA